MSYQEGMAWAAIVVWACVITWKILRLEDRIDALAGEHRKERG